MQFVDLTPQIKDAVVLSLSNHPRLNQYVPTSNIFAMQVPANQAYPYIRFGTPISTPYQSSCWTGTACRITLDAFAEGGPDLEPGETLALQVTSLIVEAMNELVVQGFGLIDNSYLGARTLMVDQEADRWRSIVEFNVTAVLTAN